MNISAERFFKAISDQTRLRVAILLMREGELCVCELTHALGEIQPKISRHLGQMRAAGIALDRRRGHRIYYRINPDLPDWARTTLDNTAMGLTEQNPFKADHAALRTMPDRPHEIRDT